MWKAAGAAAAMLGAWCLPAVADDRPTFARTTDEITLDGRLDEASWLAAIPRTKFYEIYPANVGEPAVGTSVSFAFDERNVYVAVRALDPQQEAIRATIVRRDQVLEDQDYVEVLLDPLNSRRSASFFRVNARGIVTDGQYDGKSRLRDYSPDLNFDAASSIDDQGWTAEIKIPLSSLRYQSGSENSWAYIVYRNLPRTQVATISTARVPRGESCDLCYADTLSGIETAENASLSVIPHITYSRLDDEIDVANDLNAGIDMTWKPRANTVVDATLFPDFSQIEADSPQLSANEQFALAVIEKRPFFLEGTDLLTTQIPAVYTRAFTDPDAGVRITDRSARHEYTALALRDEGGGTVIEPGTINSRVALQDFESNAVVGRNRFLINRGSLGMLATARFNDDSSHNVVVGGDGTWTPSPEDQITAQFLRSETRNPDRPDLLDVWRGQQIQGSAGAIGWTHTSSAWYADVAYESYSSDFRAWNGFVSQVGMTSLLAVSDMYFYPNNGGRITRWGPRVTMSRKESTSGELIGQWTSVGLTLRGVGDTDITLSWYPRFDTLTLAGPRSYSRAALIVSTTPFRWMPQATLVAYGSELVDSVTGLKGDGFNVTATIPLRFARFEINSTGGFQTLKTTAMDGANKTLFTERNMQVTATWHFSSRFNLRVMHQRTLFDAAPPFANLESPVRLRNEVSSVLLSYQSNWQTRYYVGAVTGSGDSGAAGEQSKQTQVFAKLSYAFSR
jgi:hypothetical protein